MITEGFIRFRRNQNAQTIAENFGGIIGIQNYYSGSGFSQPSKSATQSGSTETETLAPIGTHHACAAVSSSNYGANSYGVATFTGHDNFGVISSTRKALESEKSCKKSFC